MNRFDRISSSFLLFANEFYFREEFSTTNSIEIGSIRTIHRRLFIQFRSILFSRNKYRSNSGSDISPIFTCSFLGFSSDSFLLRCIPSTPYFQDSSMLDVNAGHARLQDDGHVRVLFMKLSNLLTYQRQNRAVSLIVSSLLNRNGNIIYKSSISKSLYL